MAEGISVSYQEHGWLKHFFRILGVLTLMGGIALAEFMPDGVLAGVIFGGLGVFLLVANEFQVARQKSAERQVIDTGSGFRWLGGPTAVEVQDSQVTAVRLKRTSKFSNGNFKGVVRRFEVWTAGVPGVAPGHRGTGAPSTLGHPGSPWDTLGRGRDRPMRMTNRMIGDAADPLAALIARVTENLKQRTAAGLADGAVLEGDGWRLAAMQLSAGRGRKVETLPFVEIDKVAVFDGKLCLWRRGQDEPAMKISPDSKNAAVLTALLSEWVEHQREAGQHGLMAGGQSESAAGASGMGRLLFERGRNEGFQRCIVVAGIAGAAGVTMLFNRDFMPVGVFLLVIASASLLLGLFFGRYLFRCYELGLSSRWRRDERRALYDEITELTYAATRIFYKGSYIGTRLLLIVRAPQGTIRYSAKVQNIDADLDGLRDQIARRIADRMLEDLRAGRIVPWTDGVAFLPQGLQFRRSKMLGLVSGALDILPYERIRGVHIENGALYLYSTVESKPVLVKPVNSVNLFPGYVVVLKLLEHVAQASHMRLQSQD